MMIYHKFFVSFLTYIAFITYEQSLYAMEHIKECFTLIKGSRCCRPARDDARQADDNTAMYPPVIFIFCRTIPLRRHVTKRTAALRSRQTTDRERETIHHVSLFEIRP